MIARKFLLLTLCFIGLICIGCEGEKNGRPVAALSQSPPDAKHLKQFFDESHLTLPPSAKPIKYVEKPTDEGKTMWLSLELNADEFPLINNRSSPFQGLYANVKKVKRGDEDYKDFFCLTHDLPSEADLLSAAFDNTTKKITMFSYLSDESGKKAMVFLRLKIQ